MEILSYILSIQLEERLTEDITPYVVRGYFGKRYSEHVLLHNHQRTGNKYFYIYPRVQYYIMDNKIILTGIEEGIETIKYIENNLDDKLILNYKKYKVINSYSILKNNNFEVTDEKIRYTFLSPWIALNQKNYRYYRARKGEYNERKFLENILVGNIILLSKSFSYTIERQIYVTIHKYSKIQVKIKDIKMSGFLGSFSVNFYIPDYFGIGKGVSQGFGIIKKNIKI